MIKVSHELPLCFQHYSAVLNDYDLPTIVATTILAATFVVVMNLIVDIAYAYIDPRVRVQ